MGRRGKPPRPSAHQNAVGGPKRNAGIVEPAPPAGEPLCPAWLSDAARGEWQRLVPVVGAGVLTKDNGQTLARYCHALVRWAKLAEWVDRNDDTYTVVDQLGNKRHLRHPNVITYEKLNRDLLRMEQEFGLTPSARTRVHAVAPEKPKQKPQAAPVLRLAQ